VKDEGGGASKSTDPASGSSAATDVSLREHLAAIRDGDLRFQQERDRRYSEISVEREKALKIKEEADRAALALAREIQTYKDEKANELREQINSERGLYASKDDIVGAVEKIEAQLKPLSDYVTTQQGGPRAITGTALLAAVGGLATVLGIIVVIATYMAAH